MSKIIDLTAARRDRAVAALSPAWQAALAPGVDRARLTTLYPGLNAIEKNGKIYAYHRKSKTALKTRPIGSPEFQIEYDAAEGKPRAAERPRPGTLAECFAAFRATKRFKALALRTRKEYEAAMRWAKPAAERIQIVSFTPRDVIAMLERCAEVKWFKFANDLYAVLKLALDEAVIDQVISVNPARVKGVSKIARPKDLPVANRIWLPEERRTVLDARRALGDPEDAILILVGVCMYTGMRHGDALCLAETDYDGASLRFIQNKTATAMRIPVHPVLKAILDPLIAARRERRENGVAVESLWLVTGVRGQPYSATGFHTMWQRFVRKLKAADKVGPHLTLHGLRHSAGTYLAEVGVSQEVIKALLGHKSFRASHIYTAQANQDRLIAQAVERLYPEDR